MTNNKFKLNQKKEADVLSELLVAAKVGDMEGMINALIDLDDNTFDKIEESLNSSIEKTFTSVAYKNRVKTDLALIPNNIEKERAGYEGLIQTIKDLEISENKKNFLLSIFELSYKVVFECLEDPSEHISITYKKLYPEAQAPEYAHLGDAGADIYSIDNYTIRPTETILIHTGISLKIPFGYEAQVRPRSGISLKTKLRVANAPGTIDSNYRGEICVIMTNTDNNTTAVIKKGEKIAQLVFNKVPIADFSEGEVEIEESNTRGEKGFGSTNNN